MLLNGYQKIVENNFSEAAKSNLNALLERGIARRETLAGMEFYRV